MPDLSQVGYNTRRSWSDGHLQAVKSALGKKFIVESNFEQDAKRGIDLVVPQIMFAVRIRQMKYSNFTDFTLRTSAPVGLLSEYDKLLAPTNKVDFLFYAFALDKNTLAAGYLIDLQALRASITTGEVVPAHKNNKDGSSFAAIPLKSSFSEQII